MLAWTADEIAVATGAAFGIGRAIAIALAGNGAVVVAAGRDVSGAEQGGQCR